MIFEDRYGSDVKEDKILQQKAVAMFGRFQFHFLTTTISQIKNFSKTF